MIWMTCKLCGKEKPSTMFRRHITEGYHDTCKTCRNSDHKKYSTKILDEKEGISVLYDIDENPVVRSMFIKKNVSQMEVRAGRKWAYAMTLVRDDGFWKIAQIDRVMYPDLGLSVGEAFEMIKDAEHALARDRGFKVE